MDDLGGLREYDQVQRKLGEMRRNYETQKPDKKGKKSLLKCIVKTFRCEYAASFMIGFVKTGVDMLSPYLI